jgi:tRNA A-37 threonylcarbamoyl transferase component Bud32
LDRLTHPPEPSASEAAAVAFRCLSAERALAYVAARSSDAGSRSPDPEDIQAHIEECDGCRLVLAEAVRSLGDATSASPNPFRTLKDGQKLMGRYEIKRFIARGGMGEVYEAFDSVLAERVALKTLLPTALDDGRAIERLAAEVRLARKVTQANVCRILEFGVYHVGGGSGTEVPFLTMEFLAGESLARRIAGRGRLPPGAVARLVFDMAAGLTAIHAAGVVHRDLKSENVFLVPQSDGQERAVIMDFGLARGLGDDRGRGSSTAAAGTPDYMAPEQVEGKPPTPAFDLYAFGVVIFEMLTGRKPFSGASPYMAALSRLRERAPAPSELAPRVPAYWDGIVGRCLERHPESRFSRAEEVVRALEAALGGTRAPRHVPAVRFGAAIGLVAAGVLVVNTRSTTTRPEAAPAPAAAAPRLQPVIRQPAAAVVGAPSPPTAVSADPRPAIRVHPRDDRPRPRTPKGRDAGTRPATLLAQAESLMLAGAVAPACELGLKSASAAPSWPPAQLFLGKCYIRLGDSATARRHYRRYLELAPAAPDQVFVRAILDGGR